MTVIPSPTSVQLLQLLGPDQVSHRHGLMRHSSAPPTSLFSQRSYNPLYESKPAGAVPSTPASPRPKSPTTSSPVRSYNPIHESQLMPATLAVPARPPALSRPGIQYNSQGMIAGDRHRSDSHIPSVMATTIPSPVTSFQSSFSHNSPNKSAKASADEIFSRAP